MLRKLVLGTALVSAIAAFPAAAQTPGYSTIVTLPVVVQSSTYGSAIFVHNPGGTSTAVNAYYIGATGSATVGLIGCPQFVVPANTTFQLSLTAMCPLNAGSNFGRLVLWEADPLNEPFTAYSRVETFSGNGFSIEGYTIGSLANTASFSYVNGLRRQAAAPGYQSNCFIGALNEAVGVQWELWTNTGVQIGTNQTVNLTANQFVRVLDVFTAAGAPAGDYTNVRARFSELGGNEASFVAFCTVQNNTSFDADFRMAKTFPEFGDDQGRLLTAVMGFTSGSTQDEVGNNLPSLNGGNAHVYKTFIQHPDWIRCVSSGVAGGGLEVGLYDPDGALVAGGNNTPSFGETYLGEKNTRNNGRNGKWTIRVEADGSGTVTGYSLTCTSGNGMSSPIYGGTGNDIM